MKKIIWSILNEVGLGGSVQLGLKSTLKDKGWFKSFHSKESVDVKGEPLPWYTYNFISFLTPRIGKDFNVFEFGCGNSTRWYSKRIAEIMAVENDERWFNSIKNTLPGNANVIFRSLGDEYVQSVMEAGRYFQIIVVDGRKRVKCTKAAVHALAENGVLILDNSEREWYQEAKDFMASNGFKRLDFYGMAPIVAIETCTSVFYRENNCLGI